MGQSSFFIDSNLTALVRDHARGKMNPATATAGKVAKARMRDVLWFLAIVAKKPEEVARQDVERFRSDMQAKGYAKSTQYKIISHVSQWFEDLKEDRIVDRNPVPRGKWREPFRPKGYSSETVKALTPEEVNLFLGGIDRQTPQGARLYAQSLLVLHTGMRAAEVCGIRWTDCDLEADPPTVGTKVRGGDFVTFELTLNVTDAINHYFEVAKRRPGSDDALFAPVTKRKKAGKANQALHPYYLWRQVKRVGQKVGLDMTPRTLRHTFAKLYHDAGVSDRDVQVALGHQSEASTKAYLDQLGRRSAKAGKAVQAMLSECKYAYIVKGGNQSERTE